MAIFTSSMHAICETLKRIEGGSHWLPPFLLKKEHEM